MECLPGEHVDLDRGVTSLKRRICRARLDVVDPDLPIDPYLQPHSLRHPVPWRDAVAHTLTVFAQKVPPEPYRKVLADRN